MAARVVGLNHITLEHGRLLPNCLDPDGHELEPHVGTLATRLAHYRCYPVQGQVVFDD